MKKLHQKVKGIKQTKLYYQCKSSRLIPGKSFAEKNKIARRLYNELASKTKRRPYIKAKYFDGDKVFLDNFWPHLNQKNPRDRKRRLLYFECALELIQHSMVAPIYEKKDLLKKEILYRFLGQIKKEYFCVQVKEDLDRKQRFLMSVFEHKK